MMPVAIAVKQAVAEGRFGRICLAGADLKYYRDQAYYNSAGLARHLGAGRPAAR